MSFTALCRLFIVAVPCLHVDAEVEHDTYRIAAHVLCNYYYTSLPSKRGPTLQLVAILSRCRWNPEGTFILEVTRCNDRMASTDLGRSAIATSKDYLERT